MKRNLDVVLLTIVAAASLLGGLFDRKVSAGSAPQKSQTTQFLENYTEALQLIQKNYAQPVPVDKVIYGSIRRMLQTLDPHSNFFDPREFSNMREEQHSKYSGLGIRIRPLVPGSGRVVIYEPPDPGTPAYRKGLRAGDVISKVEGQSIDEWTTDEVINHLRGPKGTKVNISIDRPSLDRPLDIEITREEIKMYTVPYGFYIRPGIGYVKMDRFSETTADELNDKIKKLDPQKLKGLVLDLRDNPGGLLQQAVEVVDSFLAKSKVVVSTKGRDDSSKKNIIAPGSQMITCPLVVLINHSSASASEIVAGAMQDHDRGLVVGESSFGKGLVQSVYQLENGAGLALTTAKYYTPSGRLIQRSYSGDTVFEYYYSARSNKKEKTDNEKREVAFTDMGRKVYGGGGINPDVTVEARELTRFELVLTTKDVFFEYARKIKNGEIPAALHIQIPKQASDEPLNISESHKDSIKKSFDFTPALLEDFKTFIKKKEIDFTEGEFTESLEYMKRKVKQELFVSCFGLEEGYKVGIEGDQQVLKALSLLPEAEQLLLSANYQSKSN